jgi:iron complex outermembrane recepter protein
VEMPGIVYDLDNSANNQYNIRYIIQEDRDGPQQFLLQSWHQETFFHGDASRISKQTSFYQAFIADPAENEGYLRPANTFGTGFSISTGVRSLRTFGQADGSQWTFGADWRRYEQRYQEASFDAQGDPSYFGTVFGIPQASMDDVGILTHLQVSANDRLTFTAGGRLDYSKAWVNVDDSIITDSFEYVAGTNMPNYTLGMTYAMAKLKLSDQDTLSVGNGFAMRSPDLAELYFYEPFVPLCRFGNSYMDGFSTIKPEKNWQFDLGIESKRGRCRYGARGFYATVWDYVSQIPFYIGSPAVSTHYLDRNFQDFTIGTPSDNGDTCQANYLSYNIGLATMAGGDLFGEIEFRKGLSLFGCMSYVHGQNLRPLHVTEDSEGNYSVEPISGTEPLPGMYPFNGRLSLRVSDPEKDKWGTEFTARFVASQNEVATSLAELPSVGFSVFDLRGYYRIRENVRLSLSLENLLNRDYYEPGSLVILNPSGIPTFIREPGFSAILGVDGRF